MRISPKARAVIVSTAHELFGPDAQVRLFGSRVDDGAHGGDIDLLIESPTKLANRAASACRMASLLQMRLGEQRFDVLVVDPDTAESPIHEVARDMGVAL
ncbi:MAG: nucleotidyltransferase domain-containing protein [Betaproteobacteria bacterium]|nr:nucleotidyltransferase domain-containing protein [Betaproteobacteria bacterium]